MYVHYTVVYTKVFYLYNDIGHSFILKLWYLKVIPKTLLYVSTTHTHTHTHTHLTHHTLTPTHHSEPQVSFGLVIVSGKVRRSTGESTLEGVFIQRVIPDSPADNDGR